MSKRSTPQDWPNELANPLSDEAGDLGPLAQKARRKGNLVRQDGVNSWGDSWGGGSWADSPLDNLKNQAAIAWRVATAAGILALLLAIAIIIMLPLKRSVPFLVSVDRQSGTAEIARQATFSNVTAKDAVTKSALTLYVLARETFDVADYRQNYQRVMRWSSGRAETAYRQDWDRNNPQGVHQRYRPTTRVITRVKSVNLLSPTTAQVRFETEQAEGPATNGLRRDFVATITFRFADRVLPEADYYLNPIGFEVTDYRRDNETTAPITTDPMTSAPPPSPYGGSPYGGAYGNPNDMSATTSAPNNVPPSNLPPSILPNGQSPAVAPTGPPIVGSPPTSQPSGATAGQYGGNPNMPNGDGVP